jgi:hypothetical protein
LAGIKQNKMEITKEIRSNLKEDKEILHHAITSMKKSINDFQDEKKLEWKLFKNKMNDEIIKIQKNLRNR